MGGLLAVPYSELQKKLEEGFVKYIIAHISALLGFRGGRS
jgi:hypothetical protein